MGFIKGKAAVALVAVAVLATLTSVGVVLGTTFLTPTTYKYPSSGGSLSPYLVGVYDDRDHSDSPGDGGCDENGNLCSDLSVEDYHETEPVVYLVNVTATPLTAYIVVFDNDENPIACDVRDLSGNDVTDVFIDALTDQFSGGDYVGVVKVVTFDSTQPGVKVEAGVKGWITHFTEEEDYNDVTFLRESEMQEVPTEVLFRDVNNDRQPTELKLLVDYVTDNCPNGVSAGTAVNSSQQPEPEPEPAPAPAPSAVTPAPTANTSLPRR